MKNIKELYNKNIYEIDKLTEKIKLVNANKFDTTISTISCFSFVFYAIISVVFAYICKNLGPLPNIFGLLLIGTPVLLGTALTNLLVKKYKVKQRFRSFSNSKNSKEKIEELTQYEIEKEKLISLNRILNNIHNVSSVNNNIEQAYMILSSASQNIDSLCVKKVLSKNFYFIRDKFESIIKISSACAFTPLILMAICIVPQSLNIVNVLPLPTLLNYIILSSVLGEISVITYYIKKNNDYKQVFEKMNNELGHEFISKYKEKNENFEQDLEKLIEETSISLNKDCDKDYIETKEKISEYIKHINNTYEPINQESIERQDEGKKPYVKRLH